MENLILLNPDSLPIMFGTINGSGIITGHTKSDGCWTKVSGGHGVREGCCMYYNFGPHQFLFRRVVQGKILPSSVIQSRLALFEWRSQTVLGKIAISHGLFSGAVIPMELCHLSISTVLRRKSSMQISTTISSPRKLIGVRI